jgi:hypothetical protein
MGTAPVKDYLASIEKLREDAAEAALIRDLTTDRTKREMFARLHEHLSRLANEVEQAMKPVVGDPSKRDLEVEADEALEVAKSMPPGPEKTAALKKAGLLRKAVDAQGISFAKRGRPPK